jgi:hypothetical protein
MQGGNQMTEQLKAIDLVLAVLFQALTVFHVILFVVRK